jgi:hypothetical protein
LQKQAQAIGSELQSLDMAAVDEARYLQLAESLTGFRKQTAVSSRYAGHHSPPADPPARRKGGPGGDRYDHAAAFDSDSAVGARIKWTTQSIR